MNAKKASKSLFALFLLAMLAIVSACGGDTGTSGGKTTVTVMTWEGADTNKLVDEALKKFMAKNPDIKVERIPSPNSDYGQRLASLIKARQLPDLFWAGNDTEQQYGAQGLLYDYTQLSGQKSGKFDLSQFAPASVENWKVNDKLFGLPSLMNTYGIWYNADLFEKAGLSIPKTGWTYEDLLKAAEKLTTKDGSKVTRYGLWTDGGIYSPFTLGNYSVSAGGAPFVDKIVNPTKVTASPQFIEGAQKFATAIQKGYITPPGYNIDSAQENFISGNIPMLYQGQWFAPGFIQANPSFKFGFAPLPVVKSDVQPYDAVGICSPSYVKNPEAVWKVMQFLTTEAWETILPGAPVAPAAHVPSSQPYFDTLKAKQLDSVASTVEYELKAENKQAIRFVAPWSTSAADIITAKWSDIMQGKVPLESSTQQMVQQLNGVITSQK